MSFLGGIGSEVSNNLLEILKCAWEANETFGKGQLWAVTCGPANR